MGIEGFSVLDYGLAVLLIAAGFHGLFFHKDLLKKALSWGGLQSGVLLLLLAFAGSEGRGIVPPNPLARALALSALAVLVGVLLALFTLCLVLWDKYGTLDEDKLDQEVEG
jgi:multisubunit Na+/H+ antiporter MnhC subunit